ncbi:MAG: acylphosphatase [Campylobacterales bacterium]|nr:acylphosphatase [Campylobacterales bacterium]
MHRRYSVRGRVQGVWFRATIQQHAREMGLCGYIRNCSDGSVETAALPSNVDDLPGKKEPLDDL